MHRFDLRGIVVPVSNASRAGGEARHRGEGVGRGAGRYRRESRFRHGQTGGDARGGFAADPTSQSAPRGGRPATAAPPSAKKTRGGGGPSTLPPNANRRHT